MEIKVEKITFKNKDITLVGNLYSLTNLKNNEKYPAIVVGHPGGGVKEQTAGLYAEQLAKQGYITLAFDASYQGESGGEPRFLEEPATRVEDFRCAVDYLSTHSLINSEKIGALGICAGGGYVINVAQTEHRLKAIAGLSSVDIGQLYRKGLGNVLTEEIMQQQLTEVAVQRTKEANGEDPKYYGYVANSLEEIPENAPVLYKEGYEYYKTARGKHPNSENKLLLTSLDRILAFNAFEQISFISPRPILLIAGSKADTLYFSQNAYEKAKEPKELYLIDNASHIDLYDKSDYVEQIIKKLTEFFRNYL